MDENWKVKTKPVKRLLVCWRCKRRNVQLLKCDNKLDYICVDCESMVGMTGPDIGNQSHIVL